MQNQTFVIKINTTAQAVADVIELREQHPNSTLLQEPYALYGACFEITRINVPISHRKRGYGGRLLKQLCLQADAEGITLFVTVLPSGDFSTHDLVAWYKRHSFTETDFQLHINANHDPVVLSQLQTYRLFRRPQSGD